MKSKRTSWLGPVARLPEKEDGQDNDKKTIPRKEKKRASE